MSLTKKLLQAAAGAAAGEALYVEDVFSTYLYTGTGSALDIVNGIDIDGEGGAVWIKNRSNVSNHALFDTERGAEKLLFPDDTAAEQDRTADNDSLGAFNADGFSLQASAGNRTNESGSSFASWTFRKAEKFFDVVTYTGTGSATTISHNLGAIPAVIIVKRTDTTADWQVYHSSNTASPETDYLVLNTTAATADSNTRWNDTAPTDSVFTVGTEATVNASGGTYVAYLFASDAGGFGDDGSESIIKCGSFTTDGSGNATVNLGWEPQWFLRKRIDSTGSWTLVDNMRGFTADGTDAFLYPNLSNAEATSGGSERLTSTGVNITGFGASLTFIYIAIRRPMKTPESGTEVFDLSNPNTTRQANSEISSNLSYVDMFWTRFTGLTDGFDFYNRLRGQVSLNPTSTAAEGTQNRIKFDKMNGVTSVVDWTGGTSYDFIDYFFKRATGFFDVVCYEGTGSAHAETHNLGVAPELIIVKNRDAADAWAVYVGDETDYLVLNTTAATADDSTYWNDTAPTSTQFTVGTQAVVNTSSESYVAYLFATLAGISKVGSYTGTAANLDVDCGFSAGARFILIKRTDSTGDWYVWDSERGIVAGDDPYLLLNSTAAEVTNTDYIDPLASGFTVTSSAPAALNASGGNYIFLAIA